MSAQSHPTHDGCDTLQVACTCSYRECGCCGGLVTAEGKCAYPQESACAVTDLGLDPCQSKVAYRVEV